MPKSKTHYKRKMKKRHRDEKLVKWAHRKVAEYEALPEEEKLKRSISDFWRKPKDETEEVAEDAAQQVSD